MTWCHSYKTRPSHRKNNVDNGQTDRQQTRTRHSVMMIGSGFGSSEKPGPSHNHAPSTQAMTDESCTADVSQPTEHAQRRYCAVRIQSISLARRNPRKRCGEGKAHTGVDCRNRGNERAAAPTAYTVNQSGRTPHAHGKRCMARYPHPVTPPAATAAARCCCCCRRRCWRWRCCRLCCCRRGSSAAALRARLRCSAPAQVQNTSDQSCDPSGASWLPDNPGSNKRSNKRGRRSVRNQKRCRSGGEGKSNVNSKGASGVLRACTYSIASCMHVMHERAAHCSKGFKKCMMYAWTCMHVFM